MNEVQKANHTVAVLICAIVTVLATLLIVLPKVEFSENENRSLASIPELNVDSLTNGSFMNALTDYLTDHFPFRDFWVGLHTRMLLLTGRREINGVYRGNDGALIDRYETPQNGGKLVRCVAGFANKTELEVTLMLIPTAVTLYPEKLPDGAPKSTQPEVIEHLYQEITKAAPNVKTVDVLGTLSANRETPLYYRTDHHWTSEGAYIGYLAYCTVNGLEPIPLEAYEREQYTDFYGTLYSRFGDYSIPGDCLNLYTLPGQSLTVRYPDTGIETDTLFAREYLEKRDKYSCFLNNLHELVEITNENAATQESLCVVKDSYANSMLPFLAEHYCHIYVIDPRYWHSGISTFIEGHSDITQVLVLYNMGTLDEDAGVGGIY